MKYKTNNHLGPHFEFDGPDWDEKLVVRQFYAGPGKINLLIKKGRREIDMNVDAADLLHAIKKLVPSAVKETS